MGHRDESAERRDRRRMRREAGLAPTQTALLAGMPRPMRYVLGLGLLLLCLWLPAFASLFRS